jgi:hypothetical protein
MGKVKFEPMQKAEKRYQDAQSQNSQPSKKQKKSKTDERRIGEAGGDHGKEKEHGQIPSQLPFQKFFEQAKSRSAERTTLDGATPSHPPKALSSPPKKRKPSSAKPSRIINSDTLKPAKAEHHSSKPPIGKTNRRPGAGQPPDSAHAPHAPARFAAPAPAAPAAGRGPAKKGKEITAHPFETEYGERPDRPARPHRVTGSRL